MLLGDSRLIAPTLSGIDAVISDPPYGVSYNTDHRRFTGGIAPHKERVSPPVLGDDQAFDPRPWLLYPKVVLFGFPYWSDKVPAGTILFWLKKRDSQLGTFLSDGEVAWAKGGSGVYAFRHVWHGFDRDSERGKGIFHATQKPVEVMKWVIETQRLPAGSTILDPYAGSGTTGVAALELGYNFIGIELDPRYHELASLRLERMF